MALLVNEAALVTQVAHATVPLVVNGPPVNGLEVLTLVTVPLLPPPELGGVYWAVSHAPTQSMANIARLTILFMERK